MARIETLQLQAQLGDERHRAIDIKLVDVTVAEAAEAIGHALSTISEDSDVRITLETHAPPEEP